MTDLPTQMTIPRDRAALTASVSSRLPSAEVTGLVVAFFVWLVIVLLAQPFGRPWGTGMEAISYWANHLDAPYAHSDWTKPGAYVYSPAFLQLVAPLAALPWALFMGVWTAIMLVAVRYLPDERIAQALPDDVLRHDGQLTKQSMRAVTLVALAPRPG